MTIGSGFQPRYLTVGPVGDRQFDNDGRLLVYPRGGLHGSWSGLDYEDSLRRAASLALALDVFYKRPDLSAGGQYTFRLVTAGDLRSGVAAYGILVPIPLDWAWFEQHAVAGPALNDFTPEPGNTLWPRAVGSVETQALLTHDSTPLLGAIRSTADPADPKWAAAGFRSGEPWGGVMPPLSRREQRQFTGLGGFDRERRRWQKKHPDQLEVLR